jgi:hypothetical protein
MHRWILRTNAVFLLLASLAALHADLTGVLSGLGPQGALLAREPQAAVGFIEAHGLALLFGIALWRAAPARAWHAAAAAVHALLGGCNLAFWRFFVEADLLAVGYLTTIAHGLFVALHLYALVHEFLTTHPEFDR